LVVFVTAGFTDALDGALARLMNSQTNLGAHLDPVADKLLVTSAFIALVEMRLAPAWIVVIIVGRELAVTGLRNVALAKGFSIDVSELGKVKMAVQVFTITALILGIRFSLLEALGRWALWLTVFLALVSAVQYFRRFWMQMGVPVPERRAGPEPALSGAEGSEVEGRSRGVREPLLHFTEQPKGDVPTHH